MNTHTKKEKKTTNKHKKSKTKAKHKHQQKNLLNLIPIHWSNPLSSPYQALIKPSDLIEIFFYCYPVGCFKTPQKEKQNPTQT